MMDFTDPTLKQHLNLQGWVRARDREIVWTHVDMMFKIKWPPCVIHI